MNRLDLTRSRTIALLKEFPGITSLELKKLVWECNQQMAISSKEISNPGLYFKGWVRNYYEKRQTVLAKKKLQREVETSMPKLTETERNENLKTITDIKQELAKRLGLA